MQENRPRFRRLRPLLERAAVEERWFNRLAFEPKLLRVLKAAKPTRKKKRLLFICEHGFGASTAVRHFFQEKAIKRPFNASLIVYQTGRHVYSLPELAELVSAFDFVVPLTHNTANFLAEAIQEAKRKPTVVNPLGHYNCLNQAEFVAKKIREELEKEEKGK